MTVFVIVNPRSGGGRTRSEWPAIERALRELHPALKWSWTTGRATAAEAVRKALAGGAREIIAVGGDGTINEAVNGLFRDGAAVAPDAIFGFVMSGTGGDFRRTFGIGDGHAAAIAHLRSAAPRRVDIGHVICRMPDGRSAERYFVNIASFGLSGAVVDAVNRARLSKLFGGRFAFAFNSLKAMLGYRPRMVRIRIGDKFDETLSVSTVAVCNGRYFGGGMRVAPDADPCDGMFDIVIMEAAPKAKMMRELGSIYEGKHVGNANVRVIRAARLTAAPANGTTVKMEIDGEGEACLPATFDIISGALLMRC